MKNYKYATYINSTYVNRFPAKKIVENHYYENNITNSTFGQLKLTAFFFICYNRVTKKYKHLTIR